MQKLVTTLLAGLLALAMTACSAGTPLDTVISTTQNQVSTLLTGETAVVGAGPASAAEVLAENRAVEVEASDYVWEAAGAVAVQLNGDTIAVTGAGVTVDGSRATITAAGTYVLSGSLTDGQISVDTPEAGVVQLVLNSVAVHNAGGAALNIIQAEKAVILLADHTDNVLTDGAAYVFASPEVAEPNAALFSQSDLTIAGNGSLTVTGRYQDGIASQDGLVIAGGTLTVTAADDGIRGKDYLVIEGGTLTVTAQGDGLKSDNEEDADRGYIAIAAGVLNITAGGDALAAQTDVAITGGTFTLTAGGGSSHSVSGTASAKGIKGLVTVNIDAGTFTIDAADDALHSNGSLTINGGAFTIASGDDGAHADAALTLNGGDLTITRSYEGVESAVITINGGTLRLAASDDGLNVAGGVDGSGALPGGRPGGQPDVFTYSGAYYLYIHGGYIVVEAGGDGVDVNGAIEMTAGTLIVNGPTEQMNGALDYDAYFKVTGGLLAAAGSSGMAQAPSSVSSQPALLVYFTSVQPAGTLVHIQNSAGEDILTFAPTKQFQMLAFSSPQLVTGTAYEVYTSGATTGAAQDGLYQGGAYSGGTAVGTFTVSNSVTTLGSGGGGPGGGRIRP